MGVRSSASWPMRWRQLLVFVAAVSASPSHVPTLSPSVPSTTPTMQPTAACVSGQFLDGDTCALCPEGKFTNFSAPPFPVSCNNCTVGKYTSQVGTLECVQCDTGKISAKDHSYCVDCNAGQVRAYDGGVAYEGGWGLGKKNRLIPIFSLPPPCPGKMVSRRGCANGSLFSPSLVLNSLPRVPRLPPRSYTQQGMSILSVTLEFRFKFVYF